MAVVLLREVEEPDPLQNLFSMAYRELLVEAGAADFAEAAVDEAVCERTRGLVAAVAEDFTRVTMGRIEQVEEAGEMDETETKAADIIITMVGMEGAITIIIGNGDLGSVMATGAEWHGWPTTYENWHLKR